MTELPLRDYLHVHVGGVRINMWPQIIRIIYQQCWMTKTTLPQPSSSLPRHLPSLYHHSLTFIIPQLFPHIRDSLSHPATNSLSLSCSSHGSKSNSHQILQIDKTNHIFLIVTSIRTQPYQFQVRFTKISRPKLKVYIWHYSSTFHTLRFRRI